MRHKASDNGVKLVLRKLAKRAQYESLARGGLVPIHLHLEATKAYYKLFMRVPGLEAKHLRAEILDQELLIYSYGHALEEGLSELAEPLFMHRIALQSDADFSSATARIFSRGLYIELRRLSGPNKRYHRILPIDQ